MAPHHQLQHALVKFAGAPPEFTCTVLLRRVLLLLLLLLTNPNHGPMPTRISQDDYNCTTCPTVRMPASQLSPAARLQLHWQVHVATG
jgi:hypothetical protein